MALSPQTLVVTMALILPGFPEHGNAPTVSFGAELPLYWSIVDNYEWAYQYEARARFGLFRINRTPVNARRELSAADDGRGAGHAGSHRLARRRGWCCAASP